MTESERPSDSPEPDRFINPTYEASIPLDEVKAVICDYVRLNEPPFPNLLDLRTENEWWGVSLKWM